MPSTGDRRTWFGLAGRPRLPRYLRGSSNSPRPHVEHSKRPSPQKKAQRIKLRPIRGKRLKGLDEFQKPEFVGRMTRVERRKKLEWWAMVAAAFAVGGAIGWLLV